MPTYRKLHTKIIDSYDFSEMPDDFTRVFWMLLIVVVDSEGRAIDNPSWLRSKMFPLRSDVENIDIENALTWLNSKDMIRRYEVDGRKFFYVPKFKNYQSGTEREAKSVLPAPHESLQSNSRVSTDEVCAAASASVYESASVAVSVSASVPESGGSDSFFSANPLSIAFEQEAKILAPGTDPKRWMDAINQMDKLHITASDVKQAVYELRKKNYVIIGPSSIVNAAVNVHGKNNSHAVPVRTLRDANGNPCDENGDPLP